MKLTLLNRLVSQNCYIKSAFDNILCNFIYILNYIIHDRIYSKKLTSLRIFNLCEDGRREDKSGLIAIFSLRLIHSYARAI